MGSGSFFALGSSRPTDGTRLREWMRVASARAGFTCVYAQIMLNKGDFAGAVGTLRQVMNRLATLAGGRTVKAAPAAVQARQDMTSPDVD
jgi:hypothetical protein